MKALGLAVIAVCALSIGVCVWVLNFDSALNEPAVPARAARASEPGLSAAPATSAAPSRTHSDLSSAVVVAPLPAPRPAYRETPVVVTAPQPVVDAFSDNPNAPVAIAPAGETRPASDAEKDLQVRAAAQAEFSTDPQAFAREHGVAPQQVEELSKTLAQQRKLSKIP